MKQKKNILILAPHYDTFIKGSGEELANHYNIVYVIIPKFKRFIFFGKKIKIFETINRQFKTNKKNVKIYELEVSPFLPLAVKQIKKFIKFKKIKIDFILSHFLIPYGYFGNKIAKTFDKKSILIGHGFDVYDLPFRNLFYKKIIQNILKNANKVITVSKSNLNYIKKLGFGKKTIVIPNGVDNTKFKPLNKIKCRKKLKLPINKKIILTVGNLVKIKNQKTLILAMNELIKKRKDFICYIVGSGKLEKELQETINKYGLKKNVKLIGQRPHKEIPLWMNVADLFVLPSYYESFGVVNIEALACGTPVISTVNGGSKEIVVSKEYGFLLNNPDDYKNLSKLIKKGLNKKWNTDKILNYIKKFELKKITKEIIKMFCDKIKIYVPLPKMSGGGEIYFNNINKIIAKQKLKFVFEFFPSFYGFWPFKKRPKENSNNYQIIHSIIEGGGLFKKNKNQKLILSELHLVKDSEFYNKYLKKNTIKRMYYFLYNIYRKNSLKKADKIIAISKYTKKELIKQFGVGLLNKIEIIYPIINTNLFKPKKIKNEFTIKYKNKTKLFYSGNLSLRKGSDLLPKIMEKLGGDFVLFYSYGLNKSISKQLKEKISKTKNMVAVKTVSLNKLIDFYNLCDIFLFPSRLEGFGFSIAEAMACEKPIIATKITSIPELIDEGKGGFLCFMDDINCFVEKIKFLSKDKASRIKMGEYNKNKIKKLNNSKSKYEQIYKKLIK